MRDWATYFLVNGELIFLKKFVSMIRDDDKIFPYPYECRAELYVIRESF